MRLSLGNLLFLCLYAVTGAAGCRASKKTGTGAPIVFREWTHRQTDTIIFPRPIARLYKLFTVNEEALFRVLDTEDTATAIILPLGNGQDSMLTFKIRNADVLSPELSAKYPEIHAYKAYDFHHPVNTVRINYNAHLKKFNSEILFQGQRFYLVRQEDQQGTVYYYLYNIKDFIQSKQPFEKGE